MAQGVEIKGPARYFVVAGVLALLFASLLSPSWLSPLIGSGGRGFSFFRTGYVEQHKTNLIGHWIGAAKASYVTGFILAFEGEQIVMDVDVKIDEGNVALRLRKRSWTTLWDYVWSDWLQDGQSGQIAITIPATGVYDLQLSYFAFAGSIEFDWTVK